LATGVPSACYRNGPGRFSQVAISAATAGSIGTHRYLGFPFARMNSAIFDIVETNPDDINTAPAGIVPGASEPAGEMPLRGGALFRCSMILSRCRAMVRAGKGFAALEHIRMI
jgi:hypothetical protein